MDRKFQFLLFVDNCSGHTPISSMKVTEIEYLPPNTTSVLQPMDQGIIKNLKVLYRSRLLHHHVILCLDSQMKYNVDLMSIVSILADALKAVSADALGNYFHRAGFIFGNEPDSANEEPEVPPTTTSSNAGTSLMACEAAVCRFLLPLHLKTL